MTANQVGPCEQVPHSYSFPILGQILVAMMQELDLWMISLPVQGFRDPCLAIKKLAMIGLGKMRSIVSRYIVIRGSIAAPSSYLLIMRCQKLMTSSSRISHIAHRNISTEDLRRHIYLPRHLCDDRLNIFQANDV